MSDQTIKLLAAGALLLHGLGHGGALGALAWIRFSPSSSGPWLAARSWLVPSLSTDGATALAGLFWVASLVGFLITAMSFWGVLVPAEVWRPLGVGSALVSGTGIVLFFGIWPMFNTLAALGMNAAVLVAVLGLNWPSQAVVGS